ncbi:hypothetical protein OH77DRAFT_1428763 [Trametes cingulata]|nr:hypothetical protein OH77DRAFT_1428763 [Trametes cingulata]
MYPVLLYEFEHYRLPVYFHDLLGRYEMDAEKAYLGVALAVLISFTTYYAITLSIDLYWTIVSLYLSFCHSTKPFICSVHPVQALFQNIVPLPSQDGLNEPCTSQSRFPQGESRSDAGSSIHYAGTARGVEEPIMSALDYATLVIGPEDVSEPEAHAKQARSDVATEVSSSKLHVGLQEDEAWMEDSAAAANPDVPATSVTPDDYDDLPELESETEGASDLSAGLDAEGEVSLEPARSPLLLPAVLSFQDLDISSDSLQPSAASDACPSGVAVPAEEVERPEACISCPGSVVQDECPTEESCGPIVPEEPSMENAVNFPTHKAVESALPPAVVYSSESEEGGGDKTHSDNAVSAASEACEGVQVERAACIMESALLVQDDGSDEGMQFGSDTEADGEVEAEWTSIDRKELDLEAEPERPASHVESACGDRQEDCIGALESGGLESGAKVLPIADSVSTFAIVLAHSECVPSETAEYIAPTDAVEVPSLVVESTPTEEQVPTALAFKAEPSSIPNDSALLPSNMQSAQAPSAPSLPAVDDPSNVYIGPLRPKAPHERKHTPENPDWALAPDSEPQPEPLPLSLPKKPQPHRRGTRGGKRQGGRADGKGGERAQARVQKSVKAQASGSRDARNVMVSGWMGKGDEVGGVVGVRRSARLAQV